MFGSELTIGALLVEAVVFVVEFSSIQSTVNSRSMVWHRLSLSSYCRCSRTGRSHLWSCCRQHVQHSMDLLMILLSQKMLSAVQRAPPAPCPPPPIAADRPYEWEIATASDVPPHWLRFTSSCPLCCRILCYSLHQPQVPQVPAPIHPSAKETTCSKGNPSHSPVPQSRDSPVLPPSLCSSRVPPPPHATPSVRDRPPVAIPLADHPLGLFAGVVAVRSQCTLSAPRDIAISIATATVAVSIISRRETAWGLLFR